MSLGDDEQKNGSEIGSGTDDQGTEGQDLLGGIDLGGDQTPEDTAAEQSVEQEPPPVETQAQEAPSEEDLSLEPSGETPDAQTTEPDRSSPKIVELPELKKLTDEELGGVHISTLNTLPPGKQLIKTLGLVQAVELVQARRIQELKLEAGLEAVVRKLRQAAVDHDGNAVLGINISLTPLGQLYPDSVWISACGTCCLLKSRKPKKKKSILSDDTEVDPQ